MYEQVLELAPIILRRKEEFLQKDFEERKLDVEAQVREKEVEKRKDALCEANERHKKIYEEKEKELRNNANNVLFDEARYVRTQKWLQNQKEHQNLFSDGKKKLEVSLKNAHSEFQAEKATAIETNELKLSAIWKEKERDMKAQHSKIMDRVNVEWETKLKKLRHEMNEKGRKKREDIAKQKRKYEKELEDQLNNALSRNEKKHDVEMHLLKRKLEVEKENNEILNGTIDGIKMKEKHVIMNNENIIETFKHFILSTTDVDETEINTILRLYTIRQT